MAEIYSNPIKLGPGSRGLVAFGSAILGVLNPHGAHFIANLGETAPGTQCAIESLRNQMLKSPTGSMLLEKKPIVSSQSLSEFCDKPIFLTIPPRPNSSDNLEIQSQLSLDSLSFPNGTFGAEYQKFMTFYGYHPDGRALNRFFDPNSDHALELQWILIRMRQCHDFLHTLLGVKTSVSGEVAVKMFEGITTNFPMALLSSIFGSASLSKPITELSQNLPWARESASCVTDLWLNFDFESYFNEPLEKIQKETGIGLIEPPISIKRDWNLSSSLEN